MIGKLFSFLFFLILFSSGIYSQNINSKKLSWEDMMLSNNYSFYDIQKAFNEEWKTRNYVKDDGYKLFKRWEYMMEPIIDSSGYFDKSKIEREYLKYKDRIEKSQYRFNGGDWQQLGPFGFISHYGIGRVNVVGFDPINENELWLGAASGGLWKSDNGGLTWTSKSDDYRMMGVSNIVTDYDNPDIMYISTGDRDAGDTYCYGLMKSIDNGESWQTTNLPNVWRITRVIINPNNGENLIASTNEGIYVTTDGGNTWNHVLNNTYIRDLHFKPGDFNTIYATDYSKENSSIEFYRSEDGGNSFSTVKLDSLSDEVTRISIGVSKDNPNVVYLSAAINKSGWDKQDFEGLYKSVDSGKTFEKVEIDNPPILGSQSWYDWTFTVSPTNADVLFAGGVRFYKSKDGGKNWTISNNNFNPNNDDHFHVDHHFAGFQPSTNILFVGNDGGVYKSENEGKYWTALNENLSITQYYKMSSSQTEEDLVICGAQDNGSHRLKDGTWDRVMGGDGMDCQIDYSNSIFMYASYQLGYLRKSVSKGNNFKNMISPDLTDEKGAWVTPFCLDPKQPTIIYAGYESLWRSIDRGETWSNVSGKLNVDNTIRGIEISKSNTDIIFIHYPKKIFKSINNGSSWISVAYPTDDYIQDVAISPTDPEKVWLSMNGAIYSSNDGGNTWNNISGSLPKVPLTSIAVQNNEIESIYLGTFVGIFYTDNTMTDWVPFNEGLPPVRIGELDLNEKYGKLYAGSYGRGVWKSNLHDFNFDLPYCTNLVSPISQERIVDNSVVLKWLESEKATGYLLYAGSSTGTSDLIDSLDVGNTLSYNWNDIDYEGEVFFRIRPYNDSGVAEDCIEISFFLGCYFEDRPALIKFYEETGGMNWLHKWDTTVCDISKWYGVKLNSKGRVSVLDLDGNADFYQTENSNGNNLLGTIKSLAEFEYLKSVFLSGNSLSGEIPETWKGSNTITDIDLSNNIFEEEFPDVFTTFENLQILDLSNNFFTGMITSDFGRCKKIIDLKLNNNTFEGKIPKTLSSLRSCWNMDLSNNEFSGNVPVELWFLQDLFYLDLSHNKLSGKLSKLIGKAHITFLLLNNNEFGDVIPKEIGNNKYELLNLSNNNLEGCFDDNLRKLCENGSEIRTYNNSGLPKNGDFKAFCDDDFGNCDKIPDCVEGFDTSLLIGNDTLPYNSAITWIKSDKAKGYKFSLGIVSNGVDLVDNIDVSTNSYNAGNLPIDVKLYANIAPYNDYGDKTDCEELSFIAIDPVGTIEIENDLGIYVNVYPNPATDKVVFSRIDSKIGKIDLNLFDSMGKEVISNIVIDTNESTKTVELKKFPRGMYFIKMTIDNVDYYKKLILE